MKWEQDEIKALTPILEQVHADLEPIEGKRILVLCSAAGEVVFFLSQSIGQGEIIGLELSDELLERAQQVVKQKGLEKVVSFQSAAQNRIPLPSDTLDGLISEFIIYPTPVPTQIGQPEMARVLKPGGRMVITDVIVTKPVSPDVRKSLNAIGLDYLCEGTTKDFRTWMQEAGLTNIIIRDLTPLVKTVWELRRKHDHAPEHRLGYSLLFDDSPVMLGKGIFYIYVQGTKPAKSGL
jgi:ubiquinone/menaquinone biosynthesis C-methylase UbiE